MTVDELLKRISSRELSEWQAYYQIEPFGEERMDLRFALMTANLISPHLKKGCRPRVKDFVLKFENKTPDEKMRIFMKGLGNGNRR